MSFIKSLLVVLLLAFFVNSAYAVVNHSGHNTVHDHFTWISAMNPAAGLDGVVPPARKISVVTVTAEGSYESSIKFANEGARETFLASLRDLLGGKITTFTSDLGHRGAIPTVGKFKLADGSSINLTRVPGAGIGGAATNHGLTVAIVKPADVKTHVVVKKAITFDTATAGFTFDGYATLLAADLPTLNLKIAGTILCSFACNPGLKATANIAPTTQVLHVVDDEDNLLFSGTHCTYFEATSSGLLKNPVVRGVAVLFFSVLAHLLFSYGFSLISPAYYHLGLIEGATFSVLPWFSTLKGFDSLHDEGGTEYIGGFGDPSQGPEKRERKRPPKRDGSDSAQLSPEPMRESVTGDAASVSFFALSALLLPFLL